MFDNLFKSKKNEFNDSENKSEIINIIALLIEASQIDGTIDNLESEKIVDMISKYFEIKIEKTKEYYNNALLIQKDNVSLHNFTSKIHKNYDYEKKLDIIEMLWEVVLVDKIVHDFESNLMRRIAGLLHIKDLDNGRIRKKVLIKLS